MALDFGIVSRVEKHLESGLIRGFFTNEKFRFQRSQLIDFPLPFQADLFSSYPKETHFFFEPDENRSVKKVSRAWAHINQIPRAMVEGFFRTALDRYQKEAMVSPIIGNALLQRLVQWEELTENKLRELLACRYFSVCPDYTCRFLERKYWPIFGEALQLESLWLSHQESLPWWIDQITEQCLGIVQYEVLKERRAAILRGGLPSLEMWSRQPSVIQEWERLFRRHTPRTKPQPFCTRINQACSIISYFELTASSRGKVTQLFRIPGETEVSFLVVSFPMNQAMYQRLIKHPLTNYGIEFGKQLSPEETFTMEGLITHIGVSLFQSNEGQPREPSRRLVMMNGSAQVDVQWRGESPFGYGMSEFLKFLNQMGNSYFPESGHAWLEEVKAPFYVCGIETLNTQAIAHSLSVGDQVTFTVEDNDLLDFNVSVAFENQIFGWIPYQNSVYFYMELDTVAETYLEFHGVVVEVNPTSDPGEMVAIRVQATRRDPPQAPYAPG